MNKKYLSYTNEINLILLLKIIWDSKEKIILITTISALIGFTYNYKLPKMNLYSLDLNQSENSKFIKFKIVNKLLNNHKPYINQIILNKFINELKDYEEFIFAIKDSKKYRENILKSPVTGQKQILYEYTKLLEIVEIKQDKNLKFILNLKWDDTEPPIDILKDTISLTLNNLNKTIYKEIDDILEMKKIPFFNDNLARLEYLKEQNWIAKELNISDIKATRPTTTAYYLLGYKAINKEIEIVENRINQNFELIEKEINSLKKEAIEWINYDINLIQVKSLKETKLILIISTLLGLLVGVFYVLISDTFQSKTIPKKRR